MKKSDKVLKQILILLEFHKKDVVRDIRKAIQEKDPTNEDIKQWIKDDAYDIAWLALPVPSNASPDWRAERNLYADDIDEWIEDIYKDLKK